MKRSTEMSRVRDKVIFGDVAKPPLVFCYGEVLASVGSPSIISKP
jgi:hypothetical protein